MTETRFGFSIGMVRYLPELGAKLHEMEHIKTGARLVWLEREEENKTFGIAFETLPWNDTGVFHILEHSVLCGSERYPVKEPFVELMKKSMNTFLNAMTFPDKTFYPVSSRNAQDFLNLMRVYLDAVFHPLIYGKPEIFRQEGWHYVFDEKETPDYKGVVFNEMKGAFADEGLLMESAMSRALFPDTSYRYVSGGHPENIPDLTYEEFLESHRKCYTPSNSYLFLDGDMEIDLVLKILDEEYLCDFERGIRLAPPEIQSPVDGGVQEIEYELPAEEEKRGRANLAWGRVIGTFEEREKLTAMMILSNVLCGNNQSVLCKTILSKGLAQNVSMSISDGIVQPFIKLELHHLDVADKEEAEQVVFEELERLAEDGIDHSQLEAAMANLEFQMRERDYGSMPQGLILGFQVLESWLYGGDPAANLEVGSLFRKLKQKLEDGYFEQLIRDILLDNPHRCKVIQIPSHSVGENRRQREADRLAERAASWSISERRRLCEEQKELEKWQNTVDTPEMLALLPCLRLADLPRDPEKLPLEEMYIEGMTILKHEINSHGIVYITLYFDISGCSGEELSGLSLLCRLFGKLKTRRHTELELMRQMQLLCGNMDFSVKSFAEENCVDDCVTKLCISFSAMEESAEAALELATEILTETSYDSENVVMDILKQTKTQLFRQIVMNGSAIAVGRIAAQISAVGSAEECTGGVSCYQWLKKQETGGDWPALQKVLMDLNDRSICRDALTISMTGASNELTAAVAKKAKTLFSVQKEMEKVRTAMRPRGVCKEGIVIPSDVSFAAMGNMLPCRYHGELQLAARVISLGYLWNAIRVQGGAYGTGMLVREYGLAAYYSYRDPNAVQSLDCYQKAPSFLYKFCENTPDLEGFMIGAISDASPLLTPRMKGLVADGFYWKRLSWERRCELRKELLDVTVERLSVLAEVIDQAAEGGICVIGNQEQIGQCKELDKIFVL